MNISPPNIGTPANKNNGVEYVITRKVVASKTIPKMYDINGGGKMVSRVSISDDSRFNIRPVGVVSKNRIGDRSTR